MKNMIQYLAFLCLAACFGCGLAVGRPVLSADLLVRGDFSEPLFSFTYGGTNSDDLLSLWKQEKSKQRLDPDRTQYRVVWTDPDTALRVTCVGVKYRDFPAMEWTVYFKNTGRVNTPILQDIEAINLNCERGQEGEYVLHGTKGDWCAPDSYEPFDLPLLPGSSHRFAPYGGRPTSGAFPYYNLQMPDGGLFLAIGWPGQWQSSFVRDANTGLQILAGQQTTRMYLKPGEEIRTPLVASLFWRGTNLLSAQNLWRRWMVAHNLPRTRDGALPPTQVAANTSHQFGEMIHANEQNQEYFIARYLAEGMKIDYWWMDAGWYPCAGQWVNTGTWEPDTNRFPDGLRGVSDFAHARNVKIIVWFEPERVGDPQSWLARNHPEWLLSQKADIGPPPQGGGVFGSGPGSLLNLGDVDARNWLINHIDQFLTSQGVDFYRQDFNIDPLLYWKAADTPDRQGITENLYVQGYLAYWDALRARHPRLRIDSCASGGRRDDLETMRRAVPLIRSDFLFEPTSQQCQQYGLAAWLPYTGAGYVVGHSAIGFNLPPEVNRYVFRSEMSSALTLSYDMRDTNLDYPLAQLLYRQLRQVAPNYMADFYPLTPYSLSNDVWLAWQYNRPQTGGGMVQAFRRPDAKTASACFKLHGLDAAGRYVVTNLDQPDHPEVVTGETLENRGLEVEIPDQPGAALIVYQRKR